MLGREVQKFYNQEPQIAMTFPLLVGTDGNKKMSQSLNNYISVTDTPSNIYGKIMSIPDNIMWEYFTMLTDLELDEINKMKNSVLNEKQNPFEYKKLLGELVVTELYSKSDAKKAENQFKNITINKDVPDEIPEYYVDAVSYTHLTLPTMMSV